MGALLDRFGALGVRFDRLPGDQVRAHGVLTDELRAEIRAHKPTLLAELVAASDSTHFRWQVTILGREPFEVRVVPEATTAQMQARYLGASIAALSATSPLPATQAEATELRALIPSILHDADDVDRGEALNVACADPEVALICWRELVRTQRPVLEHDDDRRTCEQCANLDRHAGRHGFRRCGAARRGELSHISSRDYSPVVDLLIRCEGFAPMAHDHDRRRGLERWPCLIEPIVDSYDERRRAI